jgi:hypothetical protein
MLPSGEIEVAGWVRGVRWEIHFLAGGGDVAGCFDDALSSVVMLVKLGAEVLEHGYEGR